MAKVNETDAYSTNLAAYRNRVDALLRYFIRKFEQYVGQTMADWIKENPEKYPETLSKLPDHEQCIIWRKKFLELYKNTVTENKNRAKAYLARFSTDKIHTEKCTYLLSAYLLFMDFVGCFDVSENSKLIDRLRQAGIFEFQCLCRGYDWPAQMEAAFAAYVSELLENKAITPVRGPQTEQTFGWFDSKKQVLLLPYSSYYESFLRFYRKRYGEKSCGTKREFQMNFLAKSGFIQLKPNGKQNDYLRADCRIEVGPAGEKKAHKENVIKISIDPFCTSATLSREAVAEIKKMNGQTYRRRAPNRRQRGRGKA